MVHDFRCSTKKEMVFLRSPNCPKGILQAQIDRAVPFRDQRLIRQTYPLPFISEFHTFIYK